MIQGKKKVGRKRRKSCQEPNTLTVTVTPVLDNLIEGDETVVLTLGGSLAYVVETPASDTVTIADAPVISVAATDPNAAETGPTGPDPGTFTVTRTGGTASSLTVSYTLGGSATMWGGDYHYLSGYVTIPAGEASAPITVTPFLDSQIEGDETVVLTLGTSTAYAVGSPASGTVTIVDAPAVSVIATDANASEAGAAGPDPGAFTVSRTGSTADSLTVNYTLNGSANNGSDYSTLSGSVTIPAGETTAAITVTPVLDRSFEGDETVVLTLAAGAAYAISNPASATVTIADAPIVSIWTTDSNAAEAGPTGPDPATFTVSRWGNSTNPLTVNYTIGGTAVNGTDDAALSGTVTIPAGQSSATITVSPVLDNLLEGDETVVVTLASATLYAVGSPASGTVTIVDAPLITVSVIDANAAEAGPSGPVSGLLNISRTGSTLYPLTVNYAVSGSATNGTDYDSLSGTVTFPAYWTSVFVQVNPILDSLIEGNETVILTVTPSTAYAVGDPAGGTVTIKDSAVATVAATDPNAAETGPTGPDPGTFTVTRSGSTAEPLYVNYSLSGSAWLWMDYTGVGLYGAVEIPAGCKMQDTHDSTRNPEKTAFEHWIFLASEVF